METPSTSKGLRFSLGSLVSLPSSSVVKKLLSWKQSDQDEQWVAKAVSTLVKKLKGRKGPIEELKRALSCPGAPSKCVTIPRSFDGRLQVLHRKEFPHVIYCRVWRWPDLQSHHELKSLPECKFAFSKKLNEVCVNPYHCNRVNACVLPPVMVPNHNHFVPGHSLLPFQQVREPTTPQTVTYTETGFTGLDIDAARFTSSTLQRQNSNLNELQPQAHSSAYSNSQNSNLVELQPQAHSSAYSNSQNSNLVEFQPQAHSSAYSNSKYSNLVELQPQAHSSADSNSQNSNLVEYQPQAHSSAYSNSKYSNLVELQPQAHSSAYSNSQNSNLVELQPQAHSSADSNSQNSNLVELQPSTHSSAYRNLQNSNLVEYQPQAHSSAYSNSKYSNLVELQPQAHSSAYSNSQNSNLVELQPQAHSSAYSNSQNSSLVEFQPQTQNSAYSNLIAELNLNDYEPTVSQPPSELVELQPPPKLMETQPPAQPINYEEQDYWASIAYYELNHRVGEIFNCKNTSITVDGFTNPDKNGDRFSLGQLSNMHRNSTIERARTHIGKGIHVYYVNGEVYVECLSNASVFVQSKISNYTNNFYPSTVCKISSGIGIKVFDNLEFSKLLSECVHCSYEAVHQLTEMCVIRIAFVKGWGAQYCRADVTSTPTWIEIHVHGALKWLDKVLNKMGGPTDGISSIS